MGSRVNKGANGIPQLQVDVWGRRTISGWVRFLVNKRIRQTLLPSLNYSGRLAHGLIQPPDLICTHGGNMPQSIEVRLDCIRLAFRALTLFLGVGRFRANERKLVSTGERLQEQ